MRSKIPMDAIRRLRDRKSRIAAKAKQAAKDLRQKEIKLETMREIEERMPPRPTRQYSMKLMEPAPIKYTPDERRRCDKVTYIEHDYRFQIYEPRGVLMAPCAEGRTPLHRMPRFHSRSLVRRWLIWHGYNPNRTKVPRRRGRRL